MGIRIPQLPPVEGLSPSALMVVSQGGVTYSVPVSVVSQGLNVLAAVAVTSVTDITLSGEQTIDGVLTSGSRVLVQGQTDPTENGIYISGPGAWTRAPDANVWDELYGAFVFVQGGDIWANSGWASTVAAEGTFGVDAITFEQFAGAGNFTAGEGLDLTGSVFSLDESAENTILANVTGSPAVPDDLAFGTNTFLGRVAGALGAQPMVAAFFAFAALTLGAGDTVAKVNAGGTAVEWGKLTGANLDPSASIGLGQLVAPTQDGVMLYGASGVWTETTTFKTDGTTISIGVGTSSEIGLINTPNNQTILSAKDSTGLNDLILVTLDGSDVLQIGNAFALSGPTAVSSRVRTGGSFNWVAGVTTLGTLSATALVLGTLPIQGVVDPTNAQDAATKNYVDNKSWALSSLAPIAALTVVSNATNGTASPTAVAAASDFQVYRRSGTALAFGSVNLASSNAVTGLLPFANIADGSANSVFGRASNSSGVQASIAGTDGQALRVSGTTLGFGTLATAAYADNSVTLAKFATQAALTVLANATNGIAVPTAVAAASDFQVFRRSGTALAFGSINLASSNAVTGLLPFANIADGSALSVLGRASNSSGVMASIAGTDGQVLRVSGTTLAFGTIATAGLADNSITFAKFQQITTDRLLGRDTAGTGNVEEISLDDTLEFTGSGGIQRAALSGDITAVAGSNTTAITAGVIVNADINASALIDLSKLATQAALTVVANATNATAVPTAVAAASDFQVFRRSGTALAFGSVNLASSNAVTGLLPFANIADGSANSVLGRATNSSGVMASIAGTDGQALRVSGTTLGFGTLATAAYADNSVTLAKITTMTTDRLLGRDTAATGNVEEISLNATLEFTGSGSIQRAALTGDITATAGSNTTAIAAGVIVNADVNASAAIDFSKLATMAGLSVLGRSASTTGTTAAITGTDGQVLRVSGTTLGFGTIAAAGITDATITLAKLAAGSTTGAMIYWSGSAWTQTTRVITDGTSLSIGVTATATNGLIKLANNETGIQFSDGAGSEIRGINAVLGSLRIGQSTLVTDILLGVKTGGSINLQVNGGNEYTFDSTTLDGNQNTLTDWASISLGSSAAAGGAINLTNNTFIYQKDLGGTSGSIFGISSSDRLVVGNATIIDDVDFTALSNQNWYIGGAQVMRMGSTWLSMPFGGTAAGAGTIRLANNFSIYSVSAAAADSRMLAYNTSDLLTIGNNPGVANINVEIATAGVMNVRFNGTTFFQFNETTLDGQGRTLTDWEYIALGTAPAGSGAVRLTNGSGNGINFEASPAGTDVIGLYCDTSEVLQMGGAVATGINLNVATGGSVTLAVNSSNEYTFTAAGADWNGNTLTEVVLSASANSYVVLETAFLGGTRRVTALNLGAAITTTEVPTNGGDLVTFIGNCASAPTATPVGGYVLFTQSGALKGVGTSGTFSTIGVAEPHCPRCGSDFALEWENAKFAEAVGTSNDDGHFAVCVPCFIKATTRALKKANVDLRRDEWIIERAA